MKNILVLLTLSVPVIVFSQKTFVSVGAELALPGHYSYSYNNRGTGFGGSVRIESSWGKHVSGIATVGYLSFAKANPFSSTPTYSNKVNSIPVQVGLKYYSAKKKALPKGLFFSAELGLMPEITHIVYTNGSKQKHTETGASCAPGTGYQLKNLELSFRLQYNLTARGLHTYYYDFRVAWAFLNQKKQH